MANTTRTLVLPAGQELLGMTILSSSFDERVRFAGCVLVPAGEYVLGDPCYSFDSQDNEGKAWSDLLRDSGDFCDSPVARTEDSNDVLAFGTATGDGVYRSSTGAEIGVDSGVIGLVPINFPGRKDHPKGTEIVEFEHPTVCSCTGTGFMRFGNITVKT